MSTMLAQKLIGVQQAVPRLRASLTVILSDGKANYIVETKNVSDMGLCLHPQEVFPVGTELRMAFAQPPELPPLNTLGIVRWSEGGKGVGVQFTSLSSSDYRALLRFANTQSREQQV
jgi:hypothetical protein